MEDCHSVKLSRLLALTVLVLNGSLFRNLTLVSYWASRSALLCRGREAYGSYAEGGATEAYCTVNCMSVEKCVLRTEVFYHYFSMQPRNMQCTQFFNGHAIDCTVNCRSVEKLRTLHIAWLHRKVMVEDFRTQYAFFNGPAIDCNRAVCPSVCLLQPFLVAR